jgi:hypothetical protein
MYGHPSNAMDKMAAQMTEYSAVAMIVALGMIVNRVPTWPHDHERLQTN